MTNNDTSDISEFRIRQREFADVVYAILDRKGWSQKQLADRMGKDASYLSRVLSGDVGLTLKTITEVESAIGQKFFLTGFDKPDIRAKENNRRISPTSANRFTNNRRKPVFFSV
jgi:transcriptional regulator with XRE-family HTH domain